MSFQNNRLIVKKFNLWKNDLFCESWCYVWYKNEFLFPHTVAKRILVVVWSKDGLKILKILSLPKLCMLVLLEVFCSLFVRYIVHFTSLMLSKLSLYRKRPLIFALSNLLEQPTKSSNVWTFSKHEHINWSTIDLFSKFYKF